MRHSDTVFNVEYYYVYNFAQTLSQNTETRIINCKDSSWSGHYSIKRAIGQINIKTKNKLYIIRSF